MCEQSGIYTLVRSCKRTLSFTSVRTSHHSRSHKSNGTNTQTRTQRKCCRCLAAGGCLLCLLRARNQSAQVKYACSLAPTLPLSVVMSAGASFSMYINIRMYILCACVCLCVPALLRVLFLLFVTGKNRAQWSKGDQNMSCYTRSNVWLNSSNLLILCNKI